MKQFISVLLLCLTAVPTQINAQNWLANDHAWTFHISGGFSGINDYFNLEVGADTTINGQICKKITASGLPFLVVPEDRYVYADADRLYAYQALTGSFVRLYDFTLMSGDTMTVPTQFSSFRYRVDSLTTVQAGPLLLRRQHATYLEPNGNPTTWKFDILEGIGMVGAAFSASAPNCSYFFLDEWSFCNSPVDGFDIKFVCFRSNAGTFSPYGLDCQLVNTDAPEGLPAFSISPNPATDRLNIIVETLPAQARRTVVYNAQGQIAQTHTGLANQLDVSGLMPGLHLVSIELESGQRLVQRFLKI